MIGVQRFSRTRIERTALAVTAAAMLGMATATALLALGGLVLFDMLSPTQDADNATHPMQMQSDGAPPLATHDIHVWSHALGQTVRWPSLSTIENRLRGRDGGEDAILQALLVRGWNAQVSDATQDRPCDAKTPPPLQLLDGAHYGWVICSEALSSSGQPKGGTQANTIKPMPSTSAAAALSAGATTVSASMALERLGRQLGGEVLLLNLFRAPVQREGDGPRRAMAAMPSPAVTASSFAQPLHGRHVAPVDTDAWPADDRWPTLRYDRKEVQRLTIGGHRYWQITLPLSGPDARQIAWIAWRTDDAGGGIATPAAPANTAGALGGAVPALVSRGDDRLAAPRTNRGRTPGVVIGVVVILSIALVAMLCVALLRWSFGVIFAPLRRAMAGLRRLAEGRIDVVSDDADRDRSDEAGAIVRAATALRTNLLALHVLRDERARSMQQQAHLLRAQLRTLAVTLDDDDRLHIEQTLDALKAPSDSLIDLAAVLAQMTGLVCGQHDRLRGLLVEREAALVREVHYAALHQELLIARQMQMSILPQAAPSACNAAGLALVSAILPAREVGGDFYDYFMLDDAHLAIVIADVSGKGVPAAFFMAVARSLLKNTAGMLHHPAAVMTRLNTLLCEDNPDCMFVTMFFGVLDLRTSAFDYVNAGHNCPLRVRRTQPAEAVWLDRGRGIALGVLPDARYAQHREVFDRDDVVFFYTDGITEACDHGDVLFGEQALHDAIVGGVKAMGTLIQDPKRFRNTGAEAARRVTDAVLDAVHAFAGGAPQADDITSIALAWDACAGADTTVPRSGLRIVDDTTAHVSETPSAGTR